MDRKTLKYARQLLNLTQAELGELIGVSSVSIAHYESGALNILPATARKIMQAFVAYGISQDELNQIANLIEVTAQYKQNKGVTT